MCSARREAARARCTPTRFSYGWSIHFEDFRWHDLRHIWASWHVQLGTPLSCSRSLEAGKRPRW